MRRLSAWSDGSATHWRLKFVSPCDLRNACSMPRWNEYWTQSLQWRYDCVIHVRRHMWFTRLRVIKARRWKLVKSGVSSELFSWILVRRRVYGMLWSQELCIVQWDNFSMLILIFLDLLQTQLVVDETEGRTARRHVIWENFSRNTGTFVLTVAAVHHGNGSDGSSEERMKKY